MKHTIEICNCGEELSVFDASSAKSFIDAGWGVTPTFDGRLIKSCPKCYEELKALSMKIYEISGSEYLSISGLVKKQRSISKKER